MRRIGITVNGKKRNAFVKDNELLLDVLREKLGVKSVKAACWRGECGLCTVILNGKPAKSCLVLAVEAEDAIVLTAEGLAEDGLNEIQNAFVRHGAAQCGFCTPAFVLTCDYILHNIDVKNEKDVLELLNGLICRCGTYNQIKEAVASVINKK
jgi:carbon-monoxide dehydrogenase small subunit